MFESGQVQEFFFFLQIFQTGSGVYPDSCLMGIGVLVRDLDHSLPSSEEVENEWSETSTPLLSLYGVDQKNFSFMFLSLKCISGYRRTCSVMLERPQRT